MTGGEWTQYQHLKRCLDTKLCNKENYDAQGETIVNQSG